MKNDYDLTYPRNFKENQNCSFLQKVYVCPPKQIDLTAPHFSEKIVETDDAALELKFPPRDEIVEAFVETDVLSEPTEEEKSGCGGLVVVSEDGNPQYAWWFLTNRSTSTANVTIERRWVYQGKWRKEKARFSLGPGRKREVMSMARHQHPSIRILQCNL